MSGLGFISPEEDGKCAICGVIEETRPYGPKGERICFDCGQKDPEMTMARMASYVLGEESSLNALLAKRGAH